MNSPPAPLAACNANAACTSFVIAPTDGTVTTGTCRLYDLTWGNSECSACLWTLGGGEGAATAIGSARERGSHSMNQSRLSTHAHTQHTALAYGEAAASGGTAGSTIFLRSSKPKALTGASKSTKGAGGES